MIQSEFRFEIYRPGMESIWDDFVRSARNATFLFERQFMEYHASRYEDYSLCVYRSNRLVAVLPAHRKGLSLFTHQGLTYGGFALAPSLHGNQTVEMFEVFRDWLCCEGFAEMTYKPVPHIYHRLPAEDELYALHRIGATLSTRALSATLSPRLALHYNSLRKRGIKKAQQQGVTCSLNNHWDKYWSMLSHNLSSRYNTKPVHSIDEIRMLNERFPDQIKLFTAEHNGEILSGVVVFDTDQCAHAQYIAASEQGKTMGALDLLFDYLIHDIYIEKQWFDFGISTEQEGCFLNSSLLLQKEGFGACGIIYDSYKLIL